MSQLSISHLNTNLANQIFFRRVSLLINKPFKELVTQLISQTVSISLLVDFEMSAVLVSHNSHHFVVFSGWHPLIQSGLSVFHSFHQTIYKERAKIVCTKIFQCYPNVFISQMSES